MSLSPRAGCRSPPMPQTQDQEQRQRRELGGDQVQRIRMLFSPSLLARASVLDRALLWRRRVMWLCGCCRCFAVVVDGRVRTVSGVRRAKRSLIGSSIWR